MLRLGGGRKTSLRAMQRSLMPYFTERIEAAEVYWLPLRVALPRALSTPAAMISALSIACYRNNEDADDEATSKSPAAAAP